MYIYTLSFSNPDQKFHDVHKIDSYVFKQQSMLFLLFQLKARQSVSCYEIFEFVEWKEKVVIQ